ncbi:cytochrome c [Pseudomonas cavernae]|uniref:Cytochrome c n=1 Tax=Pseudomonas cavernae TaxID=2320867 RepID=A0A385Z0M2_9PSED|nr:cytochrome c [Pseudomonas cavernae]AYC31162.1 cytochrome c [Pseudomonas cavernae]
MPVKSRIAVLLTCLLLSACGKIDPNSPLGQRKAIFKQMLNTSEDLGGMLRGRIPFDGQRFATGAAQLDQLARQPWQHFPQIKDDERSTAKDEVWQRQERFQQLARQLEAATATLVAATTQQPLAPAAVEAPVQKVEDSCEACHQEFRAF